MQKRIFLFLLLSFITVTLLTSCGDSPEDTAHSCPDGQKTDPNEPIKVLCADFAEYDWVINLLGDNPSGITVELLNETGADMHSFQPSVKDIARIANCDLLIYTDGISEFWMDEALEVSKKDKMLELSFVELFMHSNLKELYYPENEHEHDAEHEDEHDAEHEDEHDAEQEDEHEHGHHHHQCDEHLWLSPKLAGLCVERIKDCLCELDEGNSRLYEENCTSYTKKLSALSRKYEEAFTSPASSPVKPLMFCDRFPFFYLMHDCGMRYSAAFPNCEAEAEASFRTVVELADELILNELGSVIVLENSSDEIADTVITAAGGIPVYAADDAGAASESEYVQDSSYIRIYTLNSMQSISKKDIEKGVSYLDIMEENLNTLKCAVNS